MTASNRAVRWIRGAMVVAAIATVVLAVVASMSPRATAARAPVPVPKVSLPRAVDWQSEYDGQTMCSDWAKPGAVKLAALLDRTYGDYTAYITRSCSTSGTSEHEEGRAVDWMVDSEVRSQRKKAKAFLDWAIAPGPNGEPGAMARRLGIMYLIWDDKMWRVYRPEDGWREYNGCSALQDDGYDTSCHRDHIHISLTWDGAYARTSFWTGKAETRAPCESSSAHRKNGSPAKPKTLINTDSGAGLSADHCRLGPSNSYGSRTYTVRVPVPAATNGERPVQRVKLERFQLNAPSSLVIRSAKTLRIPQGTRPGGLLDIPLASDGRISFTLPAGYSQLWMRGLGTGQQSGRPAKVKLFEFSGATRVNTPVVAGGKVKRAPAGAKVAVQRRLSGGGDFTTVASVPVSGRKYSVSTPAAVSAGSYEYRSILVQSGVQLGTSRTRALAVGPARITLVKPSPVGTGSKAVFSGTVAGAPPAGVVRLRVKAPGGAWQQVKEKPVVNGDYRIRARMRVVGDNRVRVALAGADRTWDKSAKRWVTVG